MKFLIFFFSLSAFANSEGYPHEAVKISFDQIKRAHIQNNSCFGATVFVNAKDFYVPANQEMKIGSDMWGTWNWRPGQVGSMAELTLPSPLKNKSTPDFGAGYGDTHTNEFHNSYDFSVPEGTEVFAMEEGVVIRIVQRYSAAHKDRSRIDEVNKVEVMHRDGSFASYVHLKPNSVNLKLCERVTRGQLIGLSGHNGYSSGPHLHVDVIRPLALGKFQTIPLKFIPKN